MKYSRSNPPLICMQTQSKCYRGTRPMTVRGVLWHSTGANNPNLSRYVQPSDAAVDKIKMIALIGKNKYGNDINHNIDRNMGVNAWVGKLADGSVATVQAMPWEFAPWGCGAGPKGSCNNGWIQFEICEDDLKNEEYALAVYNEACELTAYLCSLYGINPEGTVTLNGVKVPTILDHTTSNSLGLGSNHGDIAHWFPKYGKTLATIRKDVKALMGGAVNPPPVNTETLPTLRQGDRGEYVKRLQTDLEKNGYSLKPYGGVDGIFGNGTLTCVKAFQSNHGLVVDGIVGPKTWGLLEFIPTTPFETYSVTIKGLTKADADKLKVSWPNAEVLKE